MPKYIMRKSNGVCYPYESHRHLESDEKYMVFSEGEEQEAEAPDQFDRAVAIMRAVHSIPVEDFNRPTAGRPAMPKIGTVSDLAGFKVTSEEIIAALEQTK